jgi:hypothetical protein
MQVPLQQSSQLCFLTFTIFDCGTARRIAHSHWSDVPLVSSKEVRGHTLEVECRYDRSSQNNRLAVDLLTISVLFLHLADLRLPRLVTQICGQILAPEKRQPIGFVKRHRLRSLRIRCPCCLILASSTSDLRMVVQICGRFLALLSRRPMRHQRIADLQVAECRRFLDSVRWKVAYEL